jgi:hypothetical protein
MNSGSPLDRSTIFLSGFALKRLNHYQNSKTAGPDGGVLPADFNLIEMLARLIPELLLASVRLRRRGA